MKLRNEKDGSTDVYVKHKDENNKRNLITVQLMSEAERMKLLADAVKEMQGLEQSKLSKEDQSLSAADAKAISEDIAGKHFVIEEINPLAKGKNWVYMVDLGDRTEMVTGAKVGAEKEGADDNRSDEDKLKDWGKV